MTDGFPSTSTTQIALLVAGGTGTRMGAAVPKQFLPLAGLPVLVHTLQRFATAVPEALLVVVLPLEQHDYWQELLVGRSTIPLHQVVAGGPTRLASVRAGLSALQEAPESALVAIHDGVRPLVSTTVIREAFRIAHTCGSAVTAVPLKDSLRRVSATGSSQAEDRAAFRIVQTPQCFPLGVLRRAYAQVDDHDPTLTDDASVVERLGLPIELIPGDYSNLKITTPDDLLLAEALLKATAE